MQEMRVNQFAWYCVRTKPKHEHIAAANVRKTPHLQVFHPQLRMERPTRRGIAHVTEPLFPGYIFVRCVLDQSLDEIRYAYGVNSVVHFGDSVPTIADDVIADLQACFPAEEPVTVNDSLAPGIEVVVSGGAFAGMQASVLRVLPARQRVQVLLEILGRPTEVEVDRFLLAPEKNTVADRLPFLAASRCDLVAA
jgi:transcriptional antiterminator RfaH